MIVNFVISNGLACYFIYLLIILLKIVQRVRFIGNYLTSDHGVDLLQVRLQMHTMRMKCTVSNLSTSDNVATAYVQNADH